MKIIIILIPTYLVTVFFCFILSFCRKEKQESNFKEVVGLVTKILFVFFEAEITLHNLLHIYTIFHIGSKLYFCIYEANPIKLQKVIDL